MTYQFLTGGYAAKNEPGLHRFSFSPETGFSRLNAWDELLNPSFILLHPRLPVLYTVEETNPQGQVCAWEIRGDSLRLLNALPSGGADPCHLSLSDDGKYLFAANYTSGSLAAFALDEQGNLLEMTDQRQHSGKGPNPIRQEGPHVHFSQTIEGLLCVCDLGTDRIEFYWMRDGKLILFDHAQLKPGSGPRHIAAHGRYPHRLYCVAELSSAVFHLISRRNGYEIAQELSTLPDDFSGKNTGAAIHFTRDGKFLLASNRGHDSIAVYPVNEEGNLGDPVISPCVAMPRDFGIFDDFVIVGSQRDSVIHAYRLDRPSLRLLDTGWTAKANRPTCFA